ncbi:hypothetical protein TNCV_4163901 [Trichonephila clavipes]|nr:hypothetical protein TNCV_4163901 [Trichonephila clavipes]
MKKAVGSYDNQYKRGCGQGWLGSHCNLDRMVNSRVSTVKPNKCNFISPTACPKQSSTRMASFIPLIYGGLFPRRT